MTTLNNENELNRIKQNEQARLRNIKRRENPEILAKILERKRELYALKPKPVKVKKTVEQIIVDLENLINSRVTDKKSSMTLLNYFNTFKMIIRLIKTDDLNELLTFIATEPEKVIDIFDNSKKINGENYMNNTKYEFYKVIPPVFKMSEIKLTPEADKLYHAKLEEYQYLYSEQIDGLNQVLPTFTDYISKVRELFGEDSSKTIMVELFSELKCRDDLSELHIIKTKAQAKNKSINYIIVLKKEITIIINDFKSSGSHEPIIKKLSPELTNKIKNYMNRKKVTYGDILFNQKRLSPVISQINKTVGLSGGISTIRRIIVSGVHNDKNSTYEDKKALADEMKHSLPTALKVYKTTQK